MAKNIDRFEELLSGELLDTATEEALGALAKPLKDSFSAIITEVKRVADNNDECKSIFKEEHKALTDSVTSYGNTIASNRELIRSVNKLTAAKQAAPVLEINDEHIKKIETAVLKSKPFLRVNIDFRKDVTLAIAIFILGITEFGFGLLAYRYGILTAAERLAIEEYRIAAELGMNNPGSRYEYVMTDYPDSPKEVKKTVESSRERLKKIRKTRDLLSKEFSEKLAEFYPEGLEVKNATIKRNDEIGDAIYMYCIDKNSANPFSIFVNPGGKIFINYDPEQKRQTEITSQSLKDKWSELKIK